MVQLKRLNSGYFLIYILLIVLLLSLMSTFLWGANQYISEYAKNYLLSVREKHLQNNLHSLIESDPAVKSKICSDSKTYSLETKAGLRVDLACVSPYELIQINISQN